MFFRVTIATILIWAGIASPWLVKDWLDWRADERTANRLYDAAVELPERVKSSLRGRDEDREEKSTGSSVEPYPVASNTVRVLQGFLPSSLSSGSGLPAFGLSPTPSSSRSRAVTDATGEKLQQRLEKLGLTLGNPVFIRIFKEENELEVWMKADKDVQYTLFRAYRIQTRSGVLGPKLREGDNQAPEGFYYVSATRLRPDTRHHLGIDLGFPNDFDQYHGRTGSDIMIHGGAASAGSFALSRDDMNEVFTLAEAAFRGGQRFFRINAFPFRMTDKRMESEWKKQPKWISFWANLKEGYDFFENVNLPPNVEISGGDYAFRIP